MIDRLLARYGRPVPRYTSYPTAPHFHAGIDAAHYAQWLGDAPAAASASLYLHVPFCTKLCWYCGCNTKIVARYAPVAAFADTLRREIALAAACLGRRQRVSAVHWGGGTPNILAAGDFLALTEALRESFALAADAEIAVEIDPRTLDAGMVAALAAAGVTRASLGVQDFDLRVQQAVNRVQPVAVVAQAVDALRAAGIGSINLDLMVGLPYQTPATVAATVDQAVALAPARVALFGYAHVPWMKKHQRLIDEAALPGPALRWQLTELATARLEGAGYVRIGLDHFARSEDPLAVAARGRQLRRNFQGYTTDDATLLLGFGPSAIGTLPQGYAQNASDVRGWSAAIAAGRLATVKGIALDDDDRLRGAVIESLMCDLAVDLAAVARAHGVAHMSFAAEKAILAGFAADGLVTLEGDIVCLTKLGRPLMRSVAAVFDSRLARSAARHSRAV
jgi:oxygen-independent coproporphyrinogen-3 oxidase